MLKAAMLNLILGILFIPFPSAQADWSNYELGSEKPTLPLKVAPQSLEQLKKSTDYEFFEGVFQLYPKILDLTLVRAEEARGDFELFRSWVDNDEVAIEDPELGRANATFLTDRQGRRTIAFKVTPRVSGRSHPSSTPFSTTALFEAPGVRGSSHEAQYLAAIHLRAHQDVYVISPDNPAQAPHARPRPDRWSLNWWKEYGRDIYRRPKSKDFLYGFVTATAMGTMMHTIFLLKGFLDPMSAGNPSLAISMAFAWGLTFKTFSKTHTRWKTAGSDLSQTVKLAIDSLSFSVSFLAANAFVSGDALSAGLIAYSLYHAGTNSALSVLGKKGAQQDIKWQLEHGPTPKKIKTRFFGIELDVPDYIERDTTRYLVGPWLLSKLDLVGITVAGLPTLLGMKVNMGTFALLSVVLYYQAKNAQTAESKGYPEAPRLARAPGARLAARLRVLPQQTSDLATWLGQKTYDAAQRFHYQLARSTQAMVYHSLPRALLQTHLFFKRPECEALLTKSGFPKSPHHYPSR